MKIKNKNNNKKKQKKYENCIQTVRFGKGNKFIAIRYYC